MEKIIKWICGIVAIILVIYLFINMAKFISAYRFADGYKQGQIDALNGIQNYDKIATKDSVYIKIK